MTFSENAFCVRSGLIFSKGSGSHVHVCPRPLCEHLSNGPSLPSLDMFDHSRGRCSHAPLTGEPPARVSSPGNRAVSIGSHVRQFAVPSWAGGSRHLRTAALLVCRALSGRATVLFSVSTRILVMCCRGNLASPRDSSGSGWSVNRKSCIFNVPISPWHDLHLLIVFLRAFCAFNYDWKGTTLPSLPPSPLPSPQPLPRGRWGRGWGGGWGRGEGERERRLR